MQIEVTNREARGIYSQRYINNLGSTNYIPSVILLVGLVLALFMMYYGFPWLGVGFFVLMSFPSIFLTLRIARNSSKYAKKMIEEAK